MKSYECGCDEYLSKPIQRKALLETVCRYSEKRVEKRVSLTKKVQGPFWPERNKNNEKAIRMVV